MIDWPRPSILLAALAPVIAGCGLLAGLRDVELDSSIVCGGGVCACPDNFADCDDTGLVCETDLRSRSEHCGACGHDCRGGTCRGGVCEPVATSVSTSPFAQFLATNGDHLYVPDEDGMLVDVVLDGGASPATLVKGFGSGAALREGTLFYAGWVNDEWQLFQGLPRDPASHEVILKGSWLPPEETPSVVGATREHVFVKGVVSPGYLYRLPRSTPDAETTIADLYWAASFLPDRVYWSGALMGLGGSGIYRILDGDAASTQIVSANGGDLLMPGLVGDLDLIYYTTYAYAKSEIRVWEVRVEDKTQRMVHKIPSDHNFASMGMDASYLYLAANYQGQASLLRIDRAHPEAEPRVLASIGAVASLHVVDHGIYWVSNVYGQGNTYRGAVIHYLAKPLD